MLFNSISFLLFFPVVFFLYWFLPARNRTLLLLLAGCYFYMSFVPYYLLILFGLITFGGSDAEMVESIHGSEKIYVRFFIVMAQKSKALRPLVDVSWLKQKLNSSRSPFEVIESRGL